MASSISIRFYTVEKLKPNGPSLKTALETIHSEDRKERHIQLSGGLVVRLERYALDADELAGEFIRVRDTDFPFEVTDDGVHGLQTDGPLGYGIAFRYRPFDHMLAMQFDTRIVSPHRTMDYLMQFDSRFAFSITPKMDAESWQRFNEFPVRKLRIGIASPHNLSDVEDDSSAVRSSLAALGDAYNAPVITVEIGMGNRKGALNEAAKSAASAIAGLFRAGNADVRSLKGWIKPGDDLPAEEVNLIDEILSERTEFPSPRNDPDENYRIRANILKSHLADHV